MTSGDLLTALRHAPLDPIADAAPLFVGPGAVTLIPGTVSTAKVLGLALVAAIVALIAQ